MKKFDQFVNENSQLSPKARMKIIATMLIDQLEVTDLNKGTLKQLKHLSVHIDEDNHMGCYFTLCFTELYPIRTLDNIYDAISLMEQQLKSIKNIETFVKSFTGEIMIYDNTKRGETSIDYICTYEDLMSDKVQNFLTSSNQIKKFNL